MKFETLQEAVTYFQGCQAHISHLEQQKHEALAKYQQETQAYFGVADGAPMNLLQLVALFQQVKAG